MTQPLSLFCDGGLIGRNPSSLGGTWCYCWVDASDQLIHYQSGFILPHEYELAAVTNNQAELVAAIRALASVPAGWQGLIHTDSKVTLHRISRDIPPGKDGVPEALRLELMDLRRTRRWRAVFVAGHPNKQELTRGYRLRNHLPVSRYNQFCDSECQRLARNFLDGRKRT